MKGYSKTIPTIIGDGAPVSVEYTYEPSQSGITSGPSDIQQDVALERVQIEDVTINEISIMDSLSSHCMWLLVETCWRHHRGMI